MGKVIPWFAARLAAPSSVLRPAEPSATQTLVLLALLELFSPAFKNKGSDSQQQHHHQCAQAQFTSELHGIVEYIHSFAKFLFR